MKRFLGIWLVLASVAFGYNREAHVALDKVVGEHLRRCGFPEATAWYDSLRPSPEEGVMKPDIWSTTLDSSIVAAEYVLCYKPGCALPGDGNGEGKNLDVTGWVSWLWDEEEIYNKISGWGYQWLGEGAINTKLVAAEGYYPPGTKAEKYLIHIEGYFFWTRLISIGPVHIHTGWDKVREYLNSLLTAQTDEERMMWLEMINHFFQDISCPSKTWAPMEKITFGYWSPCCFVKTLRNTLRNLPLVLNNAYYIYYCDWVDAHLEPILKIVQDNSEEYSLSFFFGSAEELPLWILKQYEILAQESRDYSIVKEDQIELRDRKEEIEKAKARVGALDAELKKLEKVKGKEIKAVQAELVQAQKELELKSKEFSKSQDLLFYPIASCMIPRYIQIYSSIVLAMWKITQAK